MTPAVEVIQHRRGPFFKFSMSEHGAAYLINRNGSIYKRSTDFLGNEYWVSRSTQDGVPEYLSNMMIEFIFYMDEEQSKARKPCTE